MLFTKLLRETDGPLVTRITSRLSRFFQRDGGSCENVTRSVEILSIETSSHSIDSGWTSSRSPTISNTENSWSAIHNPVHNPPKLKSHTAVNDQLSLHSQHFPHRHKTVRNVFLFLSVIQLYKNHFIFYSFMIIHCSMPHSNSTYTNHFHVTCIHRTS